MRLSEPECRMRFAGERVARLATIARDGSPRVVPVTFVALVELGSSAVLYTAIDQKPKSTTALARLARIEREPRVSLLVDHYDEDWTQLWWVRVDARAEVLTAGTERDTGIAFLRRKYDHYRAEPPRGAVIRFVVERWSGWSAEGSRTA